MPFAEAEILRAASRVCRFKRPGLSTLRRVRRADRQFGVQFGVHFEVHLRRMHSQEDALRTLSERSQEDALLRRSAMRQAEERSRVKSVDRIPGSISICNPVIEPINRPNIERSAS